MRSKTFVSLSISFLFLHFAQAQSNELIIQGQTGKLYVSHMVEAKETWYSIGRLFNIGPKALSTYNKLDMEKPLIIGQMVDIPLTTVNFVQTTQKAAGESLVPVYHLVGDKEWMYRISLNHNKVPIGSLEKWNHISKDQVRAGIYLVVGYLRVKTALSAYAKQPPPVPVSQTALSQPGPENATANTAATPPPQVNQRSDTTPMMMNKPPVTKKATPATGQITAFNETTKPGSGSAKPGNTIVKTDKKTDAIPPKEEIVNEDMKVQAINFNGGHFRSDYAEGSKTASGMAATFKSMSGWHDGKYYALMNNVTVGTIIKIILSSSGKTVYAKVLGPLPDMKESAGLLIRVGNSAASELGVSDSKFGVEVKY